MTPQRLKPTIAKAMVPGWNAETHPREIISKTFVFPNFAGAIQWMVNVSREAERLNHHPEWLNIYDRVEVVLTTHDAGGVTMLDVDLAKFMNAAADK